MFEPVLMAYLHTMVRRGGVAQNIRFYCDAPGPMEKMPNPTREAASH
jgi:hypothetical protein